MERFRSVFFGTPAFAVPSLKALAQVSEVVGVVCQPDRRAGRGLQVATPAVKQAAESMGLEVHQPVAVRSGALAQWLRDRRAEVAVVAAYGRILPVDVLQAPARGCVNVHASLLPRHRGAAPIQWAILAGDEVSGCSLMQMDEGLDTGPVYVERRLTIAPDCSAGELTVALAELGAELIRQELPAVVRGQLVAVPQSTQGVTWAPPIEAEQARLDWREDAQLVVRRVRAMAPRPGAYTVAAGKRLKVLRAVAAEALAPRHAPGTVLGNSAQGVDVAAGTGVVTLLEAQLEGRRPQAARDLWNGRVLVPEQLLG